MEREFLATGGATVVLLTLVVAVLAAPSTVAQPPERNREPPSTLAIAETTIAAGDVTGETATLQLTTWLRHEGGEAENVTVLYRAYDTDTEFVVAETTRSLGDVNVSGQRAVTGELTVDREGSYRLEAVVFEGNRRVARGDARVGGVGSLQPAYARSPVGFHRFERVDFPAIEYAVERTGEGRARLNVSVFLTNGGGSPAGDLRLVVRARQTDSKIVADRAEATVGGIGAGQTVTPAVTLTVPTGYNYYLDATLWRDGVIIDTARSPATLDPQRTVAPNRTTTDVGLNVSEFDEETATPQMEPTGSPTEVEGPGFGVPAALAALVAAGLLAARRWSP